MAIYTALLRTNPSADRPDGVEENDGVAASSGRFCHSLTASRTASVTVEIRSGHTVQLLETADLADRHAAGIHGDDRSKSGNRRQSAASKVPARSRQRHLRHLSTVFAGRYESRFHQDARRAPHSGHVPTPFLQLVKQTVLGEYRFARPSNSWSNSSFSIAIGCSFLFHHYGPKHKIPDTISGARLA